MNVVSFDVGFENFAYVAGVIKDKKTFVCNECRLINLGDVVCTRADRCCYETRDASIAHKLTHVVEELSDVLNKADLVLIEKQPPEGMLHVEQCLYMLLKQRQLKVTLVSPRSVHAYFGMPKGDYEGRKECSVRIAEPYLKDCKKYKNAFRKHDLSDCVLFVLYYMNEKYEIDRLVKRGVFQQFAYLPN